MRKKNVFYIIAPLMVAGLLLSGCTPPDPEPSVAPTSGFNPSPSVTPGEFDNEATLDPEADEPTQANEAFPDVEGDNNMSKEDIQVALLNSDAYVADIFDSPYLLSGKWVDEGMSYESLANQYDRYWSTDYMSGVNNGITQYINAKNGGNFTMDSPEFSALFAQVLFTDRAVMQSANGKFDCENNETTVSCLKDGQLKYDSEWFYQTVDSNTVQTSIKFTAPVRYTLDGASGYIPIHYEMKLEMTKNESADPAAGFPTFIVKGAEGKVSSDGFTTN